MCSSVVVSIHFSDDDDEYKMQLQVIPQVPFSLHVRVESPIVFSDLHIRDLKKRRQHIVLQNPKKWKAFFKFYIR